MMRLSPVRIPVAALSLHLPYYRPMRWFYPCEHLSKRTRRLWNTFESMPHSLRAPRRTGRRWYARAGPARFGASANDTPVEQECSHDAFKERFETALGVARRRGDGDRRGDAGRDGRV